jgi:hypothetical protein
MARLILVMACISALVCCSSRATKDLVLFDFESDSELDHIVWKCHTLFPLSDEHATHGQKSLQLELYPSSYPGIVPMLKDNDGRAFKALCFDVFNPEQDQAPITVRIDDLPDYPNYDDRYNNTFLLKPGRNTITISLNSLVTSGTKRILNLQTIHRLLIFKWGQSTRHK